MRCVVFIGPSLRIDDARLILPDAIYLPPARQAHVVSALSTYQPDAIGLIDGVFGQSLAVWHKELLLALEGGVRVLGAASIGALRAAELDTFGMVGVGDIYRRYSSGELEDDDEVAVLHGDAEYGFAPLSEPMVNVRATLQQAVDDGLLDAESYGCLVGIAKRIYFAERTWRAIFDAVRDELPPTTIATARAVASNRYVDLKAADARLLLETMRIAPTTALNERPTAVRSRGFYLAQDLDRTVRHADVDVPLRNIAARAALHSPEFAELNFAALNRALVQVLAEMVGFQVSSEEVDAELERFRHEHDLCNDAALGQWLADNDLDHDALRTLVQELATSRHLQHWLLATPRGLQHTRWVLDEMRLRGRYVSTAGEAADQLLLAGNVGVLGELSDLLAAHERGATWRLNTPIDMWAEEAGFSNPADLELELSASLEARRQIQHALQLVLTGIDTSNQPTGGIP